MHAYNWSTWYNWEETLKKWEAQGKIKKLIKTLDIDHVTAAQYAADALGRLGDEKAVEPLINALSSPYYDLRGHAAYALGLIGDKRAIDPLLAVLRKKDNMKESGVAVNHAAAALGMFGDKRAVDPLTKLIIKVQKIIVNGEEHWFDTIHLQRGLAAIGEPAVKPLIKNLDFENNNMVRPIKDTLVMIGEPSVNSLLKALDSDDKKTREWAAIALDEIAEIENCSDKTKKLIRSNKKFISIMKTVK